MNPAFAYVKAHPLLIVGGGVGLFVLMKISSGGVAASSGTASADPNATLSANTQLSLASLQSGTQIQLASIAASSQSSEIGAQKEVQLASIAADRATSNEMFQAQLASLAAQVSTNTAGLNAQVALSQIDAETNRYSIDKQSTVQLAQLAQQQAANETIANAQISLANINAGVANNSIFANRDIAIRQSDNNVSMAQIAASVAKQSSSNSMWGSIATAALFAVSDREAKCNIISLGVAANGLPLYEFEYLPELRDVCGHGRKIGHMADEVEKVFPDAVVKLPSGLKAVNYSAIPQ